MPTPPNNPAVAKVALNVDRDTRRYINTFHLRRTDGAVLVAADLTAMGSVVADWWLNSYRHVCKSNIVGNSIVVTKLDPANPLQDTTYIAAPGDWGGGTTTPGDVSAAVSWRTGLAGRKYRGRFYDFNVPAEEINTNDTMTGGYLAFLSAAGSYFLTHLATAALKAVIFHRADDTSTDITSVIVDQLVDSMRNRLASRGI